MNVHLEHGRLLLQLRRYKDAETALRQALVVEPLNDYAHALLALALINRRHNHPEVLPEARQAVALAPQRARNHYILAAVLCDLNRADESLEAIGEALRLNPEQPDYYAVQAQGYWLKQDWLATLNAAEQGLRLAAQHAECLNWQAVALINLGAQEEGARALQQVLAREPESPNAHNNRGWELMARGNPAQALDHFRAALRLNPMLRPAQRGYRAALQYRSKLSQVLVAQGAHLAFLNPFWQGIMLLLVYGIAWLLSLFLHYQGNPPGTWDPLLVGVQVVSLWSFTLVAFPVIAAVTVARFYWARPRSYRRWLVLAYEALVVFTGICGVLLVMLGSPNGAIWGAVFFIGWGIGRLMRSRRPLKER